MTTGTAMIDCEHVMHSVSIPEVGGDVTRLQRPLVHGHALKLADPGVTRFREVRPGAAADWRSAGTLKV
jgi:hypothetical protein